MVDTCSGVYKLANITGGHRVHIQFLSSAWFHTLKWPGFVCNLMYPLVMTNIAIENGPFIVDIPIEDGDFP